MHGRQTKGRVLGAALLGMGLFAGTPTRATPIESVLASFCQQSKCIDGAKPYGGLVSDAFGNLYGVTSDGGATNNGAVFMLAKTLAGYESTARILASFCSSGAPCADGSHPFGSLIIDPAGNLYGTTFEGGKTNLGTVFELKKGENKVTTLVSMCQSGNHRTCPEGANPLAGLIADKAGNLYGTASVGGTKGFGAVFTVKRTTSGYADNATGLVSFCSSNPDCAGALPYAPLVADKKGNLYGTATAGGGRGFNRGVVFMIERQAAGWKSTLTILARFCIPSPGCKEAPYVGATPAGGLIFDDKGNLFGTAADGGVANGGTVFEVPWDEAKKQYGTVKSLVQFCRTQSSCEGFSPYGSLTIDKLGNLYGTTGEGRNNKGTIFKVEKGQNGYASAETTISVFDGLNGAEPHSELIGNAAGNLYGTTLGGGNGKNGGVIFQLSGTGFVPAPKYDGNGEF